MSQCWKSGRLRCDDCGRFTDGGPGSSWAEHYDFAGMQLDHTHIRCPDCTDKLGPVESNAKPCDGDMNPYEGVV